MNDFNLIDDVLAEGEAVQPPTTTNASGSSFPNSDPRYYICPDEMKDYMKKLKKKERREIKEKYAKKYRKKKKKWKKKYEEGGKKGKGKKNKKSNDELARLGWKTANVMVERIAPKIIDRLIDKK